MTEHQAHALKLAVIGDPVSHSASPRLHRGFLAEEGLDGSYDAIRIAAGDGARAIDELRASGYTGLNVTTPLKEEAFARADIRDPAALAAGAVNTLVLGERIAGYNTDGVGALGALAHATVADLARARVLVLGAGPTARAVVAALVGARSSVAIWNRTRAKAESIAREIGGSVWEPEFAPDAVFSALAPNVRLSDERLIATLMETPVVIDANYGPRATLGAALGRPVCDGAAMLEASARASFALFRSAP